MRVLSINANKGLHVASRRVALLRWLERHAPTVLLLQEPWRAGQAPVEALGSLTFIGGNSNVAAYATMSDVVEVARIEERCVGLRVSAFSLHGLYFPANSGDAKRRAELLMALRAVIHRDQGRSHLMVGDFNMAPTAADGVYGDNPSGWTSVREREALEALLKDGDLVDTTRDPANSDRFTFERLIRGKRSRFRCDLAIASRGPFSNGHVTVAVDHSVRRRPGAFTDHSGLVVDLTLPVDARSVMGAREPRAAADVGSFPPGMSTCSGLAAENTAIRRTGPSAPITRRR